MVQIEDLKCNYIYRFTYKSHYVAPTSVPSEFFGKIDRYPSYPKNVVLVEGIGSYHFFKLRPSDLKDFNITEIGPIKDHPEYYL